MFRSDFPVVFPDALLRYCSAHAGSRIYIGIPPDDGSRVQDAVASDFNAVTQHRADFLQPGFDLFLAAFYDNKEFIALDIRSDGARPHMALIAENAVADIVVMRHLHVIKQYDVLKFC